MASFHASPLDPAALLDRLGLAGCARTTCQRLSGGQQQRLSLAAAIIGRPELVFPDEPTATWTHRPGTPVVDVPAVVAEYLAGQLG